MPELKNLLKNNRNWSERIQREDPEFFKKLSTQQSPEYLWIGCSDSRVPANQIVGLLPGEVFVHRNVANVVVHTDLNCLSVIQYAVEVLKVKHIIVCGHYGCGGVRAALENQKFGLIDNWLRHIQDIHKDHKSRFDSMPESSRWKTLCELNVIEQVVHVAETTIIQDAWKRGHELSIHGWIYGLDNGLVRDLKMSLHNIDQLLPAYEAAIAEIGP